MKIRTDFVTNSSSSSFIIARKPELTEKQKEVILNYVEENLLKRGSYGYEITKDNVDEIFEDGHLNPEYKEDVVKALDEGKSVFPVMSISSAVKNIMPASLKISGTNWKRLNLNPLLALILT